MIKVMLADDSAVIRSYIKEKLESEGKAYYNPYSHAVVKPGAKNALSSVLEKIERLSGEEKEVLLRKILL